MPSVLLPAVTGRDPLGARALVRAFRSALDGHDLRASSAGPIRASLSDEGRQADAVVLAGCDLFSGKGFAAATAAALTSPLDSSFPRSVNRPRRPLALVGVSAGGPLTASERWAARRLVRRADLVLLSDDESASCLAGAGVPAPIRVAADPAWMSLSPAASGPSSGQSVVVALDASAARGVQTELFLGLRELALHGVRVDLLPWTGLGTADFALAEELFAEIRSAGGLAEIVPPAMDLTGAAEAMAESGAVVAMRYRAIHAAAAAGVPVVGIAVETRIRGLACRLHQTWLPPAGFRESLAPSVLRAADSAGPSPAAVKEEVARAEAGLALLRLVLERGDVETTDLEGVPLAPDPWL
ncbi:MAG TPA: polysaccharide pyruvyl transferase family protein [Acidimicrobiales bacterium]